MWLGLNMFLSRAQKPVFALALADELPLVLWQPVSTEVIPTSIKPNKIRRIVLLLAIGVDSEQVDSPWSGIAERFFNRPIQPKFNVREKSEQRLFGEKKLNRLGKFRGWGPCRVWQS